MSDRQSGVSYTALLEDLRSHARTAKGFSRQAVNAAFLGLSFIFLAAFVPVSPLDTPLRVAVYAFVVAIALVSLTLASIAFEFKPGMSKLGMFFTKSVETGFQLVCELFGGIAVYVGISAVVWHLVGWVAVAVGYGVLILALLASLIVGLFHTALHLPDAGDAPTSKAHADESDVSEQ